MEREGITLIACNFRKYFYYNSNVNSHLETTKLVNSSLEPLWNHRVDDWAYGVTIPSLGDYIFASRCDKSIVNCFLIL